MDKTIGIRLKETRNNVGMYQEDAARSMEMSRPTLSAIEAGKRAVTAEEIKDFAGLYHVTTNWLLFKLAALWCRSRGGKSYAEAWSILSAVYEAEWSGTEGSNSVYGADPK